MESQNNTHYTQDKGVFFIFKLFKKKNSYLKGFGRVKIVPFNNLDGSKQNLKPELSGQIGFEQT